MNKQDKDGRWKYPKTYSFQMLIEDLKEKNVAYQAGQIGDWTLSLHIDGKAIYIGYCSKRNIKPFMMVLTNDGVYSFRFKTFYELRVRFLYCVLYPDKECDWKIKE